jgi:2-methylcitrate dehydratase PrpD
MAAVLAERGLTGPKEWIEGLWGMAHVFSDSHEKIDQVSVSKFRNGLGRVFLGDYLSFKLYPCCKVTHTAIEAALELVKENNIRAEEVDEVSVNVSPGAFQTVGRPFEIRTNPQVDAQFSIPYTVALALVRGRVDLNGFRESVINDPNVVAMTKKVHAVRDAEMDDSSSNIVNLASKVTIHTKKGVFSRSLETCKGHPDRYLDEADIYKKFRECCLYSQALSARETEEVLGLLKHLEEIEDINQILGSISWFR